MPPAPTPAAEEEESPAPGTAAAPAPEVAALPASDPQWLAALAVYGLLAAAILLRQTQGDWFFAGGTLVSPERLAFDLHADPAAGDPWGLGELLPYRYRPLFRWLVLAVYSFLPQTPLSFYWLFVAMSALSLLAAALALHRLLLALGFTGRDALLGGLLFLLGFPVLFSHDVPVQTREDFLGYAWIALTLTATAQDRPVELALLGAIGAWIRETCLLGVLPFLLVSQRPWPQRLGAYVLPGLSLLLMRWQRGLGQPEYDYVGISTAPTLAEPGEALVYLFATFGVLWLAAAWRLCLAAPPRHPLLSPQVTLLALVAVGSTGWTMGMVRENRISYVLFPWAVALTLDLRHTAPVVRLRRSPQARRWALAGLLLTLALGAAGLAALSQSPARYNAARRLVGSHLHLGWAPQRDVLWRDGRAHTVDLVWAPDPGGSAPVDIERLLDEQPQLAVLSASPLGGPWILLHLALTVGLVLGLTCGSSASQGASPAQRPVSEP